MIVWLRIVAPKSKRGSFKVRLPLLVGRGEDAKFRIQHHQVSRRHCEIFAGEDAAVFVRDLGSTNGTFLDGEQIPTSARTAVRSGGLVRVGRVAFVVEYDQPGVPRGRDRSDETQPGLAVVPDDAADDESFAVQPPGEQSAASAAADGDGWDGIAGVAAEADPGPAFAEVDAFPAPGGSDDAAGEPEAAIPAASLSEPAGEHSIAAAIETADGAAAAEDFGGDLPGPEQADAIPPPDVAAAGKTGSADPFAGFDPLGASAPAEDAQPAEQAEGEPAGGSAGTADEKLLDFLKRLP
jgi:pSer/pThr/pTyr-binding forkhead associated (FHA) protein